MPFLLSALPVFHVRLPPSWPKDGTAALSIISTDDKNSNRGPHVWSAHHVSELCRHLRCARSLDLQDHPMRKCHYDCHSADEEHEAEDGGTCSGPHGSLEAESCFYPDLGAPLFDRRGHSVADSGPGKESWGMACLQRMSSAFIREGNTSQKPPTHIPSVSLTRTGSRMDPVTSEGSGDTEGPVLLPWRWAHCPHTWTKGVSFREEAGNKRLPQGRSQT